MHGSFNLVGVSYDLPSHTCSSVSIRFAHNAGAVDLQRSEMAWNHALHHVQVLQNGARMGQWGANRGLLAVENLIWMGDLNYRLTMADTEVRFWVALAILSCKLRAERQLKLMVPDHQF